MEQLDNLQRDGAMGWRAEEHAWVADPDAVVKALVLEGFQEYKREVTRHRESCAAAGGLWQGLDPRTGSVATVIWITHASPADEHVFIEIDGRPVEGDAWAEIDDAILTALAQAGGRLTLEQIAERVGMSEDGVRSIVAMLAERGAIRIVAVELVVPRLSDEGPIVPARQHW